MRGVSLSTSISGMTRLRHKGNASPSTLYDCLNAYVTLSGTIRPRPGTVVDHYLPAGTHGLVSHKGKFYVFSALPVTMTDSRYVNVVLRHPSDSSADIQRIHFAKPFMGAIYVVASFDDTSTWHFWAEELDEWAASTVYRVGKRVYPTTANGFAYKATRSESADPKWAPGVARAVNDVIEPTSANGFKYTAISTTGSNPASGLTEPAWPAEDGATIVEYSTDGVDGGTSDPTPGDDSFDPSDDIDERYDNPSFNYPPYTREP